MTTAKQWIKTLGLQPHREGGWFHEIFRSAETLQPLSLPERYLGSRAMATSIYFLLQPGEVSHFHRLRSDELWHFYEGSTIELHLLHPDGSHSSALLGRDHAKGEQFFVPVPHGVWMGAHVIDPKGYALVGCSVCPGFDFMDFESAPRADLLAQYPEHARIITRLTNQ